MKDKLLRIGIIVVLLVNFSCKDSTTQTNDFGTSYFPNKVGTTWNYSFYDSLAKTNGNVIVTIVGETTILSDQSATIWEYKYPDRTDTLYVTISTDTVRIIRSLLSPWYNQKFIIPLAVGNHWKGDWMNDTCYVSESNSVRVAAGNFSNGYKIVEGWGALNDYGFVHSWFVPYVGIVSKWHKGWSFGMANDYYELVSYKIN